VRRFVAALEPSIAVENAAQELALWEKKKRKAAMNSRTPKRARMHAGGRRGRQKEKKKSGDE
jgi:hypothetical protein